MLVCISVEPSRFVFTSSMLVCNTGKSSFTFAAFNLCFVCTPSFLFRVVVHLIRSFNEWGAFVWDDHMMIRHNLDIHDDTHNLGIDVLIFWEIGVVLKLYLILCVWSCLIYFERDGCCFRLYFILCMRLSHMIFCRKKKSCDVYFLARDTLFFH